MVISVCASKSERERWSHRKVFRTPEIPLYVQWTQQKEWPPHDHDFIECVLVTSGSAVHRTAYRRNKIKKGDILLIAPETWHAYENCRGFRICNFCFGPELLRHELSWLFESPILQYLSASGLDTPGARDVLVVRPSARCFQMSVEHLKELTRLLAHQAVTHRAAVIGRMLLFLDLMSEQYSATLKCPHNIRMPEVIANAINMLECHLSYHWTVEELSRKFSLNYAYFIRLFKSVAGLPPMAYLARLRARKAASLLLKSEQTVGEIAASVGWPDLYYFSRRFREHFGMSATEYRKQIRCGNVLSTVNRAMKATLAN